MDYSMVAAATLVFIGLVHSILGEVGLLMPLFRAEWSTPEIPRRGLEIILRFAWHATTLAWVALGAILVGFDPLPVVVVMSVICSAIMFVALRGHLSWPLFALIAISALLAMNVIPEAVLSGASLVSAGVFVFLAIVHVYWAFGGKAWSAHTVPTVEGKPMFVPTKALTLGVAVLFLAAAATLGVQALRPDSMPMWVCIAIGSILVLRAVGDFRTVGFMKPSHETRFEQLDDLIFTPVVVLLAFGSFGGALI